MALLRGEKGMESRDNNLLSVPCDRSVWQRCISHGLIMSFVISLLSPFSNSAVSA